MKKKRIMVDMSATLIHHGHIRLLKKAKKLGYVIVALTKDLQVKKCKGYNPEIKYKYRKEILLSIKYVDKVIESNWAIDDKFLKKNKIDILIRGHDHSKQKFHTQTKILKRTKDISSSVIRKKVLSNYKKNAY